ncbi:hypothetical protein [Algoriphagus sp.]|uniref:hypothetical protein n=1 Tax=Algoriphagus sp. TaxID=1872435 RepID=UPI003919C529
MNTNLNKIGKSALLSLILVFLLAGCAKKITFLNSSIVPAAEGTVAISQDKNQNYKIDLTLKRLAEPSRLTPPKKVYVVWIETNQSGTQNIGQLSTTTKGLSSMLSSSLSTVSPHRPLRVFITAEDDAEGNYPDMPVVLTTGPINIK